jgi:Glyoxalase-like domain
VISSCKSSTLDRVELDHVLIAVTDLAAAARRIEARYGLASVEGGRHPNWGTANRIVPLGTSYLELIAVVDQQAAADSTIGRWVASGASRSGRPLGWAVRTGKLDETARRLGLTVSAGSRVAPTGEVLRWRSAGIQQAAVEPLLPFFIEWGRGVRLPGSTAVAHPAAPAGILKLLLEGDPGRLAAWLGDHALPIVVRAGSPAVAAIVLSAARGEIVLGAEQP